MITEANVSPLLAMAFPGPRSPEPRARLPVSEAVDVLGLLCQRGLEVQVGAVVPVAVHLQSSVVQLEKSKKTHLTLVIQ